MESIVVFPALRIFEVKLICYIVSGLASSIYCLIRNKHGNKHNAVDSLCCVKISLNYCNFSDVIISDVIRSIFLPYLKKFFPQP